MAEDNSIDAYPLHWPDGWPRTKRPEKSTFSVKFSRVRKNLLHQLILMGATHMIVSTNIPLRENGLVVKNYKSPDDKGVAVYFEYNDKTLTFACDRWDSVAENLQSIKKTIATLRGFERWATPEMMERVYSGFACQPS